MLKGKLEAIGTELPGGTVLVCKKGKECKFCMDSLSFKETTEFKIILGKQQFSRGRRKWVASYLFNMYVDKLNDNYAQMGGGV
jgi:hypothetical protein